MYICISSSKPTTFSYDDLLRWALRKNANQVTCNESGKALLIEDLLYNVGLPGLSTDPLEKKLNKKINIFLASSLELSEEREQFEIFINRENKRLNDVGIFINLTIWEDFFDAVSKTRSQDEYNKSVISSDIVVCLFFTKVGKYSAEEFEVAYNNFKIHGKPIIFTYFKNAPVNSRSINGGDFNSIKDFEHKLAKIGHFPTEYSTVDDLKYKFKIQLEKFLLGDSEFKNR